MFQLETTTLGSDPLLRLVHTPSGAEAAFAPTRGARLLRLRLAKGDALHTVLDAGTTAEALDDLRSKSALLAPWPNRIRLGRYHWAGHTHQLDLSEPARSNALHGLVNQQPFVRVSDAAGGVENGVLAFEHAYRGDAPGYPFAFRLRVVYRLAPDALHLHVAAQSEHPEPIPFGWGWHPYFTLNAPAARLHLHIPARSRFAIDGMMIPLAELPYQGPLTAGEPLGDMRYDDCFGLAPNAPGDTADITLYDPEQDLRLHVSHPVRDLPYTQIYTHLDGQQVAIEPMSCPPDVFNQPTGLIVLAPGETWAADCAVRLS